MSSQKQRLLLPVNMAKLTASWKTDSYKTKFGYTHYGADIISTNGNRTLWACGNGTVVAAGRDSVVGNVVAVMYPSALNHKDGKARDVVLRCFHLDSIAVMEGQAVTKDTKLGVYGNTGQLSTGAHLHIEADTDTAHPLYSPTVSASSLLKGRSAGANDSTMTNPLEWLHVKSGAPDNQTWTTANDAYIRAEDKALPALTEMPKDIQGIDVSRHNGTVDWPAVKASGKDFVFVRVGWAGWDGGIVSNGGLDASFHENMKGAIAAGLNVGVYVYSYCKTPEAARAAALETLELVKPYRLTYPVAFDIEDTSDSGTRYDKMTKAQNNAIAAAFLSAVKQAGYYGMLYTYKSFAESYLDVPALSCEVWIAQYANSCTYSGSYGIWQYNGDVTGFIGSCAGVKGPCDLNAAYQDYADIIKSGGFNQPTASDDPAALKAEIAALKAENAVLRSRLAELGIT